MAGRDVFVTGGTGYMGSRLVLALLARGHGVRVLARAQSIGRVPRGAAAVAGDALDARTYTAALRPGDTMVHLVGTPHPSPAKAAEFQRVDLPSIHAAVDAARRSGVSHLVYVSIAHPAPIMKAYIDVRVRGERAIADAGLAATILRPWYVLGPGHRWPVVLIPVYSLLESIPSTCDGARRLGLVTIDQMIGALVHAVEHPPGAGTSRVLAVEDIRRATISRQEAVSV